MHTEAKEFENIYNLTPEDIQELYDALMQSI